MSFTVHHPRIPGVKVEGLSAAERDAHKKAGWTSSKPSATDGTSEVKARPKKAKSSTADGPALEPQADSE